MYLLEDVTEALSVFLDVLMTFFLTLFWKGWGVGGWGLEEPGQRRWEGVQIFLILVLAQ